MNQQLKTFQVNYYFDGKGSVNIQAKSKKEAEDKFFEGEFEITDDSEWGENYIVEDIIKLDIK